MVCPRSVAPSKKSTRAIVPSESVAVAVIVTGVFVENVVPSAGVVNATVGGEFPLMVMVTRVEVFVARGVALAALIPLFVALLCLFVVRVVSFVSREIERMAQFGNAASRVRLTPSNTASAVATEL